MSFEIDVADLDALTAVESRLVEAGHHVDGGDAYLSVEDPAGNTVVLSAR